MDFLNANVDMATINQKQYNNINTKNMKKDELRVVCDNFESFFSQQLLDISLKNTNIAGSGTGSEIIKGMYTESLATSSTGTLGISDILYKFLEQKGK
jgi:Rod binding domain-containing protein